MSFHLTHYQVERGANDVCCMDEEEEEEEEQELAQEINLGSSSTEASREQPQQQQLLSPMNNGILVAVECHHHHPYPNQNIYSAKSYHPNNQTPSNQLKSSDCNSHDDSDNSTKPSKKQKHLRKVSRISKQILTNKPKVTFKPVEYSTCNIYQTLIASDIIYVTGEILIDMSQFNAPFKWHSPWNQVKSVNRVCCDFSNEVVSIELNKQSYQQGFRPFNQQGIKYMLYPDQEIHDFAVLLMEYEKIYEQFQFFTNQKVTKIIESPQELSNFHSRKQQFAALTKEYFKKLNDDSIMFLAFMNFPDLSSKQFLSQELIYSKNLANILGASMASLANILNRQGVVDFYPFETSLQLNYRVVQAIVDHFHAQKKPTITMDQFNNFKDIEVDVKIEQDSASQQQQQQQQQQMEEEKKQAQNLNSSKNQMNKLLATKLAFRTFDEIAFEAEIKMEYLTLDAMLNTPKEQYQNDFYSTIIKLEVSSETQMQIQKMRNAKKASSEAHLNELQSDIAYTVLSEFFVSKNQINTQTKVCGTADIV